jgi:hypothetical protein
MPKWTQDWNDERHSVRVRVELFEAIRWGMNLRVILKDRRSAEGLWISSKSENNGGEDGVWSYYSALSFRTEDWDLQLDFLDIENLCPGWLVQAGKKPRVALSLQKETDGNCRPTPSARVSDRERHVGCLTIR